MNMYCPCITAWTSVSVLIKGLKTGLGSKETDAKMVC